MPDLDNRGVAKAYARWAPVYDLVFGAVFARGRRAAIGAAERLGGRILEVGVGTGISLPGYDPRLRLVGVDRPDAKPPKAAARERTEGRGPSHGPDGMAAGWLASADAAF